MSNVDPTPLSILAVPAPQRNARLQADTQAMLAELKLCLAASANGQQEITAFLTRYDSQAEASPLASRALRSIRDGRSAYLRLQQRLIELTKRYMPLRSFDQQQLQQLHIDRNLRAKAVLISFVAALTLYDNHLAMRTVLEDDRLRRLLLRPAQGSTLGEDETLDMLRELNSEEKQLRLKQLTQAYQHVADTLAAANDPDLDFLQMAVESNVAYRYARESALQQQLPSTSRIWGERISDAFDELSKSTMGTISELFGNGIGMVEMRKGKLWQNAALEQHLAQILQPLDLLLEKTPFRLTDKFIPGHFGHVAMWVGSAAELAEFDIFSEPMFQQPRFATCEAEVGAGRSVLEALRTGVQLSTLAEFLMSTTSPYCAHKDSPRQSSAPPCCAASARLASNTTSTSKCKPSTKLPARNCPITCIRMWPGKPKSSSASTPLRPTRWPARRCAATRRSNWWRSATTGTQSTHQRHCR